jgi:hypothetical protein
MILLLVVILFFNNGVVLAVLSGRHSVDTAEEFYEIRGVMTVSYKQCDLLDRSVGGSEKL